MPSEIVVALCALAGTIGGSLLGVLSASRLTVHRIGELEKKMDKHNNLVERLAVCERDMKSVWRAVDDLKDKK